MGIGAVFGAVNTMYSAVAARTREIATLRALGFGGGPVVVSVLVESLLLALVGGAIGGGLAYVGFNGFQTSTINWQTFSQVAFAFAVTPGADRRRDGLCAADGAAGRPAAGRARGAAADRVGAAGAVSGCRASASRREAGMPRLTREAYWRGSVTFGTDTSARSRAVITATTSG